MLKTTLIAILATAAASLAAPARAAEEGTPTMQAPVTPKKTGHVPANGVNYYYAIHGEGEPLLLLHGGLGQIEMFGPNLAALAEGAPGDRRRPPRPRPHAARRPADQPASTSATTLR